MKHFSVIAALVAGFVVGCTSHSFANNITNCMTSPAAPFYNGTVVSCVALSTYQGTVKSVMPGSTTSEQMAGFAATITPGVSGKLVVCVQGYFINTVATTAGEGVEWRISYGTGAAPAANAALTGTQLGSLLNSRIATTATVAGDIAQPMPSICSVITGLTVGVPYWLDASQEAMGTVTNILHGEISAHEIQ